MRVVLTELMIRKLAWLTVLILALALPPRDAARADTMIDLALVLAVDCSYSVDAGEFEQQMKGLAAAFRNREVAAAIASVPGGRIGVALVQWSGPASQVLAIDWRILASADDAIAFAAAIEETSRLSREGATSIAGMVRAGSALLARFPWPARRRVIDISSDGINNAGGSLDVARDSALARGITLNALAIMNELTALDRYFERHLIGGPGAFVVPAGDYSDYGAAILRKLLREIASPNV